MKIAELPFRERPLRELLNLDEDRAAPQHDYAGFGWAHVPRISLIASDESRTEVTDALVIAVHTADDAPAFTDDLQLEFDLDPPVAVMASRFLATFLPQLPRAQAIVLCVCNPHAAHLAVPAAANGAKVWLPTGDVYSWREHATDDVLLTATTWSPL